MIAIKKAALSAVVAVGMTLAGGTAVAYAAPSGGQQVGHDHDKGGSDGKGDPSGPPTKTPPPPPSGGDKVHNPGGDKDHNPGPNDHRPGPGDHRPGDDHGRPGHPDPRHDHPWATGATTTPTGVSTTPAHTPAGIGTSTKAGGPAR